MTPSRIGITRRSAAGVVLGVLAVTLTGVPAGRTRADTIHLADGSPIENVKIVRANWDNVGYEVQGVPQAVEGYRVTRLDRPSTTLTRITALIENGDFKAAEEEIKKARSLGIADWEKAQIAFLEGVLYLAWASRDAARAKTAIDSFDGYLKQHKSAKDFYVPHATFELGRAYMAAGQPKSAEKYFQELADYGGTKGIWGYKASIGQALAIIEGGERTKITSEARRLLGGVIGDRKAPEEVREEAIVVRAQSFLAVKDYQQARDEISRGFLKRNGDVKYNENYARACNIIGDSFRLEGGKESLEKAEVWYLRTTCFFKRYPAVHRSAVESLVDVYGKQGNAKRAQEWKDRLK
jgi:tetratricopeptide (TPR) repeat protein